MTSPTEAPRTLSELNRLAEQIGARVVTNEALEFLTAAALPAAPAGLAAQLVEARKAIESEIAMASDPEGKDQFEQGALAAYHFALSVLPDAAYAEGEPGTTSPTEAPRTAAGQELLGVVMRLGPKFITDIEWVRDRILAIEAEAQRPTVERLREARAAISRAHGSLHLGDTDGVDRALEEARAALARKETGE